MSAEPLFRMLRPWLEEHFGGALRRIALDAGSSCPNRDGTKGFGGCAYCDVEGSGTGALRSGSALREQLELGLARLERRAPGTGAIAYFQSYSNTYVAPERLRETLSVVEPHIGARVRVVSIATRPDTLSDAALEILADLAQRVPVWVELGLEAADDDVLAKINRLHTVQEFLDATARLASAGLPAVGHAILGLPGDGRAGASRTAECLARSGVFGVKVHHLMVLRRTQLEKWWREERVQCLEPETYVEWLADFVERLRPDQVLHRLTGDAQPPELLAPRWRISKNAVRELLARELARRGSHQGCRWDERLTRAGKEFGRSSGTG